MAVRFRLSSLAMCLAAFIASGSAGAQDRPEDEGSGVRPAPASSSQAPRARQEDCSKLPGGNAPINRIARLEGGLSVRNLDLTYLGKPLFELTDEDFEFLKVLWPLCKTFDEGLASTVAGRLKAVVSDAKAVRQDSLDWIKQVETEAQALKPGQAGIEKIHDFWQQMLNREFEMLQSDMSYIAGVLSKRRDELYAAPEQRQRTLVSPFDPGPPETRTLRGSGG